MTPEQIRQRREELNLTQATIGIPSSTYRRIEKGLQVPSPEHRRTLHDMLGNWRVKSGTLDVYIFADTEHEAKRRALELYWWCFDVTQPIIFEVTFVEAHDSHDHPKNSFRR